MGDDSDETFNKRFMVIMAVLIAVIVCYALFLVNFEG